MSESTATYFHPHTFVQISPDLIRAVGNDANRAVILARIEFRTRALPAGEIRTVHHDEDGNLWWRANYEALAEETGLSRGQVNRGLRWLRENGWIETRQFALEGFGDRTSSVRLLFDSESIDRPESVDVHRPESVYVPSTKNLEQLSPPSGGESPSAMAESDDPPALLDIPAEDSGTSQREQFEKWWTAYPRKVGKKDAWERWRRLWRARSLPPVDDLIAAVRRMAAAQAAANPDAPTRFILHPATWLNGEHWNDEVEPVGGPAKKQQFWQFLGISRDEYLAHKFDESEAGTVWMQQTRQRAIREGWQA